MRDFGLFFLACASLLAACTSQVTPPARLTETQPAVVFASPTPQPRIPLTNDYIPPGGRPLTPAPPESPGEFRLLLATSADGVTFRPSGRLVLDQANVPDLIMGDNNLLYLYFTAWQVGDQQNATGLAISPDFGQTWVFKTLSFKGHAGDPDIVRLPDGTFRLYLTTEVARQRFGIIYMDSPDGIHFGEAKTAFSLDSNVVDSTTFLLDHTWHMFVLDNHKPEQWHGESVDGTTFGLVGKTPFKANGSDYIVSNGVKVNGGYRLYGFNFPQKNFRSFFSSDGHTWNAETGVTLAFDPSSSLESQYIKDPAVIQLPDGSYLMVYVTRIP